MRVRGIFKEPCNRIDSFSMHNHTIVAVRRHDRALKIAPATPFFRVKKRLGDFPIFDPDFKMIDLKSMQDPTRDLIQSYAKNLHDLEAMLLENGSQNREIPELVVQAYRGRPERCRPTLPVTLPVTAKINLPLLHFRTVSQEPSSFMTIYEPPLNEYCSEHECAFCAHKITS